MTPNGAIRPSRAPNVLIEALRACHASFAVIGIFSLVMNALMLVVPLYMLSVYDRVLGTGRYETLIMLTVMATAALLILGALDVLRSMLLVRLGGWLNAHLAPFFLASSVRARLQGDEAGAQPLRDLGVLQNFVGGAGMTFLFDLPMVPLFVVIAWMLHPELGLLALGSAVLLFALSLLNDRLTRKSLLEANVDQIRANLQAETTIRNAEVVRAMGMLPTMVDRWRGVNARVLDAARLASERSGMIVGFTKALRLMIQVAVLGWGALLVIDGKLTPGSMIACSILIGRALAPVEQAMAAWKVFTAARIAYGRLKLRLLTLPPETERTRLPAPRGRLSIEGLTFIPNGSSRAVLRQVSFSVEPGEVLAVVGPSAAGKSTLCRMLVGLLQPTSGQIRLDGADLAQWDPDHLGRFIGYLPQDVELFSGTVGDNIARMHNGIDEDVVDAARLGHAHDMILRLADGYDTQIGDAGVKLSAGQRQRIGLARAVYGNPRLLVLDEPNANLDQVGEAALAGTLNDLKERGAAIVIVGHRPSTLAHADKILVLKDGKVEIWGTRDAVLQRLRKAAVASSEPEKVSESADAATTASVSSSQRPAQPQAELVELRPGLAAPRSDAGSCRPHDDIPLANRDRAVDDAALRGQQGVAAKVDRGPEVPREPSPSVREPDNRRPRTTHLSPRSRAVPRTVRTAVFLTTGCGVWIAPLVALHETNSFPVTAEWASEMPADLGRAASMPWNSQAPSIASASLLEVSSSDAGSAGDDSAAAPDMSIPPVLIAEARSEFGAGTEESKPTVNGDGWLAREEEPSAAGPQTRDDLNKETTSQTVMGGSGPSSPPPSESTPPGTQEPRRVATLIARGDEFLKLGDVTAARLCYKLAAASGDGAAALAFGRTYDPSFLETLGVLGVRGDLATAAQWYLRARAKGIAEAEAMLASVGGGTMATTPPGQPAVHESAQE